MGPLAMSITGLQLSPFILHPANEVVSALFLLTGFFSLSAVHARGDPCRPCSVHTPVEASSSLSSITSHVLLGYLG